MPDIHEQLKNWGKAARELPSRNEALKSEMLSKYSSSPRLPARQAVEKQAFTARRIPWLSLAFATVAVLIFALSSLQPSKRVLTSQPMPASSGGFMVPEAASPLAGDSFMGKVLRNPVFSGSPVTDTREFLKTNYYSTLRTRHVVELAGRVQTVVRGFGGRVDGASSAEKSGYVSFAVPADKFELFRQEVKSLAHAKLYTEQTYSENLLPQKQSIEEQMTAAQKTLDQLKADRDALTAAHKKALGSLQAQLNSVLKERAAIPADDPRQGELAAREQSLRGRIASENRDYQNKLASLEQQIKSQEDYLANIQKQDQNLLNNVATVNGTISLQWISFWNILDLYIPGSLIAWIILLAAVLAYFWESKKQVAFP